MRYKFVESRPGYSCHVCDKRNTPGCRLASCGGSEPEHKRKDGKNGHFVTVQPSAPKPDKANIGELLCKLYGKDKLLAGWVYPTKALWLTEPEAVMINKLRKVK